MLDRPTKKPTDLNQLSKLVVEIATGQATGDFGRPASSKNPAAVALARLRGQRGGRARALKLTAEQRKEIAAKAAAARWKNDR